MGLSFAPPLADCLYSVAPLAQRLKVFAVVGACWQWHDVVYKYGCGDAASTGTVGALRLRGEHRVVDAKPPIVSADSDYADMSPV